MRGVAQAVVLAGMWMLWSGHTDPLMLGFAFVSIAGVLWMSRRMGIDDDEGIPTSILGLRTLPYLAWLLWQVLVSNLLVARRIWQGPGSLAPRMITVPTTQRSAVAQVLYANSITLTPGTVSVRMEDGEVMVHALLEETAADLESGEMARRVGALEIVRAVEPS